MKTSTKLIIVAGVVAFVVSLIVIIVLLRKNPKKKETAETIETTTPKKGNSNALMIIAIPFAGFLAFLLYKLASRVKSSQNVLNSQEPVLAMQRMNRLQKTQDAVRLLVQKGIQNGRRNKLSQGENEEKLIRQMERLQSIPNAQRRGINARADIEEVGTNLLDIKEILKKLTEIYNKFYAINPDASWPKNTAELFDEAELLDLLDHQLLNIENTSLRSVVNNLRETVNNRTETVNTREKIRAKRLEIMRAFNAVLTALKSEKKTLDQNVASLTKIIQDANGTILPPPPPPKPGFLNKLMGRPSK